MVTAASSQMPAEQVAFQRLLWVGPLVIVATIVAFALRFVNPVQLVVRLKE